jgi:[glutamine synthetase] adenylyltransferase / [glutamine synthetase]-adenylyl-L-tyrosine phosphorylase
MTRARIVWASSPAFAAEAAAAVERALRRPRDAKRTARDVRDMRALMERERPPSGPWDLKLSPGGLVDIEFAAQHLQLARAAEGGPLRANTAEALAALNAEGVGDPGALEALQDAWRLQQNLTQLLKVALEDDANPEGRRGGFRRSQGAPGQGPGGRPQGLSRLDQVGAFPSASVGTDRRGARSSGT